MKILSIFFVLLLALQTRGWTQSQEERLRCEFYQAYLTDQLARWPELINQLESLGTDSPSRVREVLLARYALCGYYFSIDQPDAFRQELKFLEEGVNKARRLYPREAVFLVLDAGVCSYHMALSRLMAPVYYSRYRSLMREVESVAANESLYWFQKGSMASHLPRVLGGNPDEAALCLRRSVELSSGQEVACNWFHVMCQVSLLKVYSDSGDQAAFQSLQNQLELRHGSLPWLPRFLTSP